MSAVSDHIYGYNERGNLVYNKYCYTKATANGTANIIIWRCREYRRLKCRATIKTKNKELCAIRGSHTHEAKNYGKIIAPFLTTSM
uniref:FLYWCH-type domain-containing protein n=2 Tax=Anopheles albimanus TaxID=7167 RepID=A0A182FXA7_ANOAL